MYPIFKEPDKPKNNGVVPHRINQMKHIATDGPLSYRALAFTGGIGMVVTSTSDWMGEIFTFSFIRALISVYTFLFGIIFCILEVHLWFPSSVFFSRIRERIHEYANFLRFLWGRGLLQLFAGSLQLSRMHPIDMASGGFMCLVGILSIIVGRSTARRLSDLRKTMSDENIVKDRFDEFDLDGDGSVTPSEFAALLRNLGIELGKNEVASVYASIDLDQDLKITSQEFKEWWSKFEIQGIDDAIMLS